MTRAAAHVPEDSARLGWVSTLFSFDGSSGTGLALLLQNAHKHKGPELQPKGHRGTDLEISARVGVGQSVVVVSGRDRTFHVWR